MKSIVNVLDKKYGKLFFGLFCGVAYFGIIYSFIMSATKTGGGLLVFFFAPAIICLPGVYAVKYCNSMKEAEENGKLAAFMWAHIILFAISVVLIVAGINGVKII